MNARYLLFFLLRNNPQAIFVDQQIPVLESSALSPAKTPPSPQTEIDEKSNGEKGKPKTPEMWWERKSTDRNLAKETSSGEGTARVSCGTEAFPFFMVSGFLCRAQMNRNPAEKDEIYSRGKSLFSTFPRLLSFSCAGRREERYKCQEGRPVGNGKGLPSLSSPESDRTVVKKPFFRLSYHDIQCDLTWRYQARDRKLQGSYVQTRKSECHIFLALGGHEFEIIGSEWVLLYYFAKIKIFLCEVQWNRLLRTKNLKIYHIIKYFFFNERFNYKIFI